MERIEITSEKVNEILEGLSGEARIIFEQLLLRVASTAPINDIKLWIKNFEEECPIDNLIARIVSEVINKIGGSIYEEIKETNKSYTGHDAMRIAVTQLKKVTNKLELHITDNHCEKDCLKTH